MKPKKRQKLCHNCEGEVDLDVIVCPYCAADLREEKPEQSRAPYPASPSNPTFASLYPPPHAPKAPEPEPVAQVMETKNSPFLSIFLLSFGAQLLLLGLLTLLFSHHGAITLKWSARFWFVYLFASLPLLVFGYKRL